jgi:hypothetical protein
MKKLLTLITCLLLLTSLQGQILRYSNYTLPTPLVEDTTNYYSVYKAIYDEMANPPGHDTAHFQSAMVYSLDTCDFEGGASLWDRMDFIDVIATKTHADAFINWASPGTFDITDPGSTTPTFTKYSGIAGNGTSDYLSANYAPGSDSIHVGNNKVTLGFYLIAETDGGTVMGAADNGGRYLRLYPESSGNMGSRINTGTTYTTSNTTSRGLSLATRRSSTEIEHYINGSSLGSTTSSESTGLPTTDMYLFCYNNNGTATGFNSGTIAIVFILDAITDAEAVALTTIFETYMDAIGAGMP